MKRSGIFGSDRLRTDWLGLTRHRWLMCAARSARRGNLLLMEEVRGPRVTELMRLNAGRRRER
jgi:hypothetical protein